MTKHVRFADELMAQVPAPAKTIDSIQFSLLKASDTEKVSLVEVSQSHLYEESKFSRRREEPNVCGPIDRRMGTTKKGVDQLCGTCHLNLTDCPGHFGHIRLSLPVFHVGYFKHTLQVLQGICKTCAGVLLSKQDKLRYLQKVRRMFIDKTGGNVKYMRSMLDDCKKMKECIHCGAYNGIVRELPDKKLRIMHDKFQRKGGDTKDADDHIADIEKQFDYFVEQFENFAKTTMREVWEELDPQKVLMLFEKMSTEDIELFLMNTDLCKPSDLILTQMPAPPVCIRPTVAVSNDCRNEDDLTTQLGKIMQANNEIDTAIAKGMASSKLLESWIALQWQTALYYNSEQPGVPTSLKEDKPMRSLNQRIKGKQGRFRQNLSGKRVDFTGRTVISPDPNCAIDEVMVPDLMAKTLTFPEAVTRHNIEQMRKLVLRGPKVHPGANYVEPLQLESEGISMASGRNSLMMPHVRKKLADELKIGDIVERHLQNGDTVLFNRQPSLHRVSIMAHRARIMPHKTLRFNECVCAPYNADFDGDEMNIHVPQTLEAKAEARTLMAVSKNLCVPKAGEPLIAATQDFLTTSYLITNKDYFINRTQFMQYCSFFSDANERVEIPPPTIIKPVELWTGKQLFNVMLRPNRQTKVYVNTVVEEKNLYSKGEQMCPQDGYVLFQNSELLCGNVCKPTMGGGSKKGLFYSIIRDNSPEMASACMLRLSKFSARWISSWGLSIGISDVTPSNSFLVKKKAFIDDGRSESQKLIELYEKGTLPLKPGCNIEQTLESKMNKILGEIREKAGNVLMKTLPKRNTPRIMATCGSKGSNLNLCQMISCVGPQVVNGARIPDGFGDRTLPHFQRHSKAPDAKGFVGNAFYDGLTAIEFFFHTISGREGLIDTAVKTANSGYMHRRLMKSMEDLVIKYDGTVRASGDEIIQFRYGDDGLDPMSMDDDKLPVSLGRLYTQVRQSAKQREDEVPLTPNQIRNQAQKVIKDCPFPTAEQFEMLGYVRQKGHQGHTSLSSKFSQKLVAFLEDLADKVEDINKQLKEQNADKQVARNFESLTKRQLDDFVKLVWSTYERACVVPGDTCGAISAQSIGEPATQMTLKTFHFAGVASMNVTMGMPRITEIINAVPSISTPIIEAQLIAGVKDNEISARIVKGRIEKTELGDISEYIKEVYTPKGCYLSVKIDQEAIRALQLEVTMESIKRSILKGKIKLREGHVELEGDHITIKPYDVTREKMYFEMQNLKAKLPRVIIKGIWSIQRAVITEEEGKQNKAYRLLIEGKGLHKVMITPGIEFEQTSTNDLVETFQVLGIEAARTKIISEIKYVMGSYGLHIDDRHMTVLADTMTNKGQVLGIQRFGMSKMKGSPLMLASFEKTADTLYEAAIMCRQDRIEGVSECIMIGKLAPIGSGAFKLVYDEPDTYDTKEKKEQIKPKVQAKKQRALLFDDQ